MMVDPLSSGGSSRFLPLGVSPVFVRQAIALLMAIPCACAHFMQPPVARFASCDNDCHARICVFVIGAPLSSGGSRRSIPKGSARCLSESFRHF
ncbi:Uncharacterised protein [Salmonella enterica]|nr:Uncharacterised protein [Salmonella enterica]